MVYELNDQEFYDNDKEFYNSCCTGNNPRCGMFYSRRAVGSCEEYSPPACCGEGHSHQI